MCRQHNECARERIGAALAAAAIVVAIGITPGPGRAAEFADIVAFVDRKGWSVELSHMCAALELPVRQGCTFRQVSVQEDGRGDPRAFNVPEHEGADVPYVLVFHLTPLFGEFFVVSARGELLKAFYRAKGRGYDPMPIDDVREEFERDLAYWRDNLVRIMRGYPVKP